MLLPAFGFIVISSACDTTPDTAADTSAGSTTAGAAASTDRDADEGTLRDLDNKWLQWAMAKNVDSMMTLYTDDARSFMPGQKPITSAQARRQSFDAFVAMNLRDAKLDNLGVDFSDDGTMATTYGTYSGTMTMGGQDMKDEGAYLNVYKRTPAGWKYVADMSVSTMPMGPPPGSAAKK